MKIFASKVEEIKPAKELKFEPTPGFGKYRPLFPEKAVEHPAKMNTHLLEFLIERYTTEGEIILDPMAGTGSTGVLASLHNRNAVLIELEKKFADWIDQAKEKVQTMPTLAPKGEIKVIQGDSRKLSELLSNGQTDTIITSPPYGERRNYQDIERSKANIDKYFSEKNINPDLYAEDPANINRLEHKEDIDAIITSPPYADTPIQDYGTSNKALLEFEAEVRASFKEKGYFEYNEKRYTEEEWRAINKGELKPRGMPELWAAILKNRQDSHYNTDDSKNIGNLPIGNIDAIITSPPYADDKKGGEANEEAMAERWDKIFKKQGETWNSWGKTWKTPGRMRALKSLGSGYSASKENIGNLPIGDIDAIITSPPYADQMNTHSKGGTISPHMQGLISKLSGIPVKEFANNPKRFMEAWKIARSKIPHKYSDSPDNIGNLPLGNVDAIITSPPYSESMTKKRKGYTVIPELAKTREMSQDTRDDNIANLSHGNIDAIITSPPYAEANRSGGIAQKGYEGKYGKDEKLHLRHDRPLSDNPNNIGNMKKETYLQAMFRVYAEMYAVLKVGGRAIIVVKPFTRNKKVVDLPYQTWLLLQKTGFQLEDVLKLRLDKLSFWRILQYQKNPRQEQIRHEYILVVKK